MFVLPDLRELLFLLEPVEGGVGRGAVAFLQTHSHSLKVKGWREVLGRKQHTVPKLRCFLSHLGKQEDGDVVELLFIGHSALETQP